ncbi:MAG: hypothetical protein NT034_04200, partial [Candidatus Magasanikbacteria bacterium]|nr:hypothetical protein [Candidatus Magasanikbacteria bacterium]
MKKTILFGSLAVILVVLGFLIFKNNNFNPNPAQAQPSSSLNIAITVPTEINDKHIAPVEQNVF